MERYTPARLRETLDCLRPLFDVVRLVDPVDAAVLTLGERDAVIREPGTCFRLWGRDSRCENCSSQRAAMDGGCQTKCEEAGGQRFYVISRPLILETPWRALPVVLEIVTRMQEVREVGAGCTAGME